MTFDPASMADESSYEGQLEKEPMEVLLSKLIEASTTGRITIRDEHGINHLFWSVRSSATCF